MSVPCVRAAESADLPEVLSLWSALAADEQALGAPIRTDNEAPKRWLASFERHLGRFSFLWVAEHDGRVMGFVLTRLKTRPAYVGGELIGEISSIFVDPAIRRVHTGHALVRTAIDALEASGAKAIEVDAHECNASARAFWESQGFQTNVRTYRLRRDSSSAAG